jgi:hypothetical protein
MQVQRHVERLEARQEHVERRVVEEPPVDAERAVDQAAHEPEIGDAPGKFVGRRRRRRGRQRGEPRQPPGRRRDRGRQVIVRPARRLDPGRTAKALGRRLRVRQHLQIDARGVHVRDPFLADVPEQPVVHGALGPGQLGRPGRGGELVSPEVLLESDRSHETHHPERWRPPPDPPGELWKRGQLGHV